MKPVHLGSTFLLVLSALSMPAAQAADPTSTAAAPVKKVNGVLADSKGMTVYTFDKDTPNSGKSACTGQCAQNWPPVQAGDVPLAAPYSVVTREDGNRQLAYKGKPLYTFVKDKKAGDRNGDKVMNVWHVVTD